VVLFYRLLFPPWFLSTPFTDLNNVCSVFPFVPLVSAIYDSGVCVSAEGASATEKGRYRVSVERGGKTEVFVTGVYSVGMPSVACSRRRYRRFLRGGLLRMQWRMWLLCLIVDVYGACMVFRNLAFYRFRTGPRLTQDLGFDMLPEWQSFTYFV
jgi:hypothetical protein